VRHHEVSRVAVLFVALAAGACTPAVQKPEAPVFFPPAPAQPRIQYLTSFTGVQDIEHQSAFNRFIAGENRNKQLNKPYGVAMHGGKIYVCDTNVTVTVFDLPAKTFSYLKGAVGPGVLKLPLNISISDDGTKYVADPIRGQVVAYNANDDYEQAFGAPGAWKPVDAAPFENRLYVVDAGHARIVVFDRRTGAELTKFGDTGDASERLYRPTNIAFDKDGYLYVTDVGRFQIVKFDRDGHFRSTVGKPGDNLGHFARPKGIAVDHDGRLYAVDASFNNVQVFNRNGRLLMFFGGSGNKPGALLLPAKVAIDYDDVNYFRKYAQPGFEIDYLLLVTSQFGDRRVNVFGYGRQQGLSYPSDDELLRQIDEKRQQELTK